MRWIILASLVAACDASEAPGGVLVRFEPDGDHWLDRPFPDDARRGPDGRIDLTGLPTAKGPLGAVVDGWARRIPSITRGFCATCPAWVRLEGPLPPLPDTTEGLPSDPVQWIDLDTGERFPLALRFVDDPYDDPFLAPHTLVSQPLPGRGPRSGGRVAVVVTRGAGAARPAGWQPPAALEPHLAPDEVAMATVWTAQSPTAELRTLARALDGWIEATDPWSDLSWVQVTSLTWSLGTTPNSQTPAVVQTLALADGTDSVAYLRRGEGVEPRSLRFDEDWPMAVYLAEIPVPYWQGLEGQPWMRFGALHLTDTDRDDGTFDASSAASLADPATDTMRVVVSLPRGPDRQPIDDAPVIVWDHGTGGTAANPLSRRASTEDTRALLDRAADAGVAIVGHDQPFYGTRWPLMDNGFTDGSLGFYNIVNLPAFRDNQRQGGMEGLAVQRMLQDGLPGTPLAGRLDPRRVHRLGHSLGSVTANVGLAADPAAWTSAFLSGPSAAFAFNFLQTGLSDGSGGLFDALTELFEVTVEGDEGLGAVIAAALGIDAPEARDRLDRSHPAVALFSWIVDPSDSAAFGADQTVPTTVLMGIGDRQTVNDGARAMVATLPDAALVTVEPIRADLDPHHALFTEDAGRAAFQRWLDEIVAAP